MLYRWATRCHTRKSKRWVVDRYFGRFNKSRKDRWTFGVRSLAGDNGDPEDRDNGAYVPKFQWTKIVRHVQVKGRSSPDDPHLLRYWADRGRKQILPALNAQRNRLLRQQRGRCAACGDFLLHADQTPRTLGQWEQWAATITKAIRRGWITEGSGGQQDEECLIHASCRSRLTRPSPSATPARLA